MLLTCLFTVDYCNDVRIIVVINRHPIVIICAHYLPLISTVSDTVSLDPITTTPPTYL
jgi:hypothetical protein